MRNVVCAKPFPFVRVQTHIAQSKGPPTLPAGLVLKFGSHGTPCPLRYRLPLWTHPARHTLPSFAFTKG